jgi:MYXO-CTERM domain-containing protein
MGRWGKYSRAARLTAIAIGVGVLVSCGGERARSQGGEDPAARMRPLPPSTGANVAPDTGVLRVPDVSLAARLLVITADGQDAAFGAITEALGYLGTPYDVLNATTDAALTADRLAVGDHGNYYGVLLDLGELVVGSNSAFSDDEWMTLAAYEARFGVRRVALYSYPIASYGLVPRGGGDLTTSPIVAQCTAAGAAVFAGMNCARPLVIAGGWGYLAGAADAATTPLLVDGAGNLVAATRLYPDGREALVLTFSQSRAAAPTLAVAYGIVDWVARGLFIGERHVTLSAHVDDFFLPNQLYTGGTYRMSEADFQAITSWQDRRRADPLTADLRLQLVFNGYGAVDTDALTRRAIGSGSTFAWISHSWAHRNMNAMAYPQAFDEFSRNDQFAHAMGLLSYATVNAVTPEVSGLNNPQAMQAAHDAGVRTIVSDTAVPGQANPSPNAGLWSTLAPDLLWLPRRPTELYFNVSLPAEWEAEHAVLRTAMGYRDIVADQSESLVRYLLRGEVNPWMFHQSNLRVFEGDKSMLSDLLDATLDRYAALATWPVGSPTMDVLARRTVDRMRFDASRVQAVIRPDGQLEVSVVNAATVPVTGLCTPSAERYGGKTISHLALDAGQKVTLPISTEACPGGAGSGGGGAGQGGQGGGGRTGYPDGGSGGAGGGGGEMTAPGEAGSTGSSDAGCGCAFVDPSARREAALLPLLGLLVAVTIRRRRT